MQKGEIAALKIVAGQSITKVLDALNVDYEENYHTITAPCPIHGGDRPDAFSWHMEYGVYQCFSRGCHDKHGKDVIGLVRGVLDCSFPRAIEFLRNIIDVDKLKDTEHLLHKRENKRFIERERKRTVYFPEESLQKLVYHKYLETRGYPKSLIESYQIGMPSSKYKRLSDRIIVPIRDIEGRIVGFSGRTLKDNWRELGIGKWEHSANFNKKEHLFNIDRARKHIQNTGRAIICEGPLDVLRLEQAGIHNAVAVFGRKLHNPQISLLMQAGANTLIFAFDADDAGQSGTDSALQTTRAFFNTKSIFLDDGDIGDRTIEEVREIFKHDYEEQSIRS